MAITKTLNRWNYPKSRGNWKGVCIRFDCKNRGKCEKCVHFDKYIKKGDK